LWVEVWVVGRDGGAGGAVGGEECGELGVGSSESARDVEDVSGMRSGAAEGAPGGGGADEDDVGEDEVGGGLGGVATGEDGFVLKGEGAETGEEAFDPATTALRPEHRGGEGEREEGGEGNGSHGSEVAQATGEAAMADGGGWVEVAAKVAVFEGEVGGDEDLVTSRGTKDGTIVADAEGEGLAAAGEGAVYLLDELEFTERLQAMAHVD
jgi:hypothetical protein